MQGVIERAWVRETVNVAANTIKVFCFCIDIAITQRRALAPGYIPGSHTRVSSTSSELVVCGFPQQVTTVWKTWWLAGCLMPWTVVSTTIGVIAAADRVCIPRSRSSIRTRAVPRWQRHLRSEVCLGKWFCCCVLTDNMEIHRHAP